MHVIEIESGRRGYVDVVSRVISSGERRSPRGMMTYDLHNVALRLDTAYDALPVQCGRGVSSRIAAAEAIQLIGGFHDPELMTWASPNFKQFAEPSGWFWGAYGTRIGEQLHHIVRKLTQDPDTRQAVVTLWRPELDNQPGHRDYPCTVSLMYAIHHDQLCATTVMRSNDVWLGLPYDMFQFTQLQLTLAHALQIETGSYTHFTHSLHLYDAQLDLVDELHDYFIDEKCDEATLDGISSVDPGDNDGWWMRENARSVHPATFRSRALHLTYDTDPLNRTNLTESETWYARQLLEFPGRKRGTSFVEEHVDECREDGGAA